MARKIQIAIIGAGHWATENHIPVLQSLGNVQIAGVSRPDGNQLRRVCEKFGIAFGAEDYGELLSLPDLDGVVVSSPHHLHFEHAKAALERGLPVLCEKPMSLSASEARQLASLVHETRRTFLIAYGWNYTGFASEARKRVRAGEIGEVQHVVCHMASALRDLFSGDGAWWAEQAFLKPELKTWSDPAIGGGFAHGQLTHALGLLFWICDLRPAEVFALVNTSKTGADLFDAISCRFENGATGLFSGAGTVPPGAARQVDIRLFGTEGILALDIERPRLEVCRNAGGHFAMPCDYPPGGYECVAPLRTFVDLLAGKKAENRSPVTVGLRAVELIDAALRSARSGQLEKV